MKRNRIIFLSSIVIALSLFTAIAGKSEIPAGIGMKAPDFKLEDVRGNTYSLDQLKGKTVLLSFVNTQADILEEQAKSSRGEVNFIKSIYRQYSSKGFTAVIIDSSYLDTKKSAERNKLINFAYDWELDSIPLLIDKKSYGLAHRYEVKELPATILINREGIIDQKWNGLALSSQLALAVENLVGPPEYRIVDDDRKQIIAKSDDTPSMTKFPGLLPARMLSEEIWLIDGGKLWESGVEYPVKWLVLNGNTDCILVVTVENAETGEAAVLVGMKRMEAVSEEEEKALLAGFENTTAHVYLLDTPIKVDKPGKYIVKASVYKNANGTNPVYSGQATITAN
jgi:cytochrome c biogenesis protein CcmG, thiol:disulfide interchange protein DsbE